MFDYIQKKISFIYLLLFFFPLKNFIFMLRMHRLRNFQFQLYELLLIQLRQMTMVVYLHSMVVYLCDVQCCRRELSIFVKHMTMHRYYCNLFISKGFVIKYFKTYAGSS